MIVSTRSSDWWRHYLNQFIIIKLTKIMITKRYFEFKKEENNLVIEWDDINPPEDNMDNYKNVIFSIINGTVHSVNKSPFTVRELLILEATEIYRWNNIFRFFDDYTLTSFILDVSQIPKGQLLVEMYSVNLLFINNETSRKRFENYDSDIPDGEIVGVTGESQGDRTQPWFF